MKSKTLAVVLLSGGLDSTTLLAVAVRKYGFQNVVAVSVSYGQKHSMELEQAKKIAKYYRVEHKIIDLSSWLPSFSIIFMFDLVITSPLDLG